jgi:hypothetical protein
MKEELDDLLRSWRPTAVDSSTFKREVWQRIERSRGATQRFQRFFEWLGMPQIASLAAALALIGGVFLGSLFAGHNAQRAYLRDIDPYAQVFFK